VNINERIDAAKEIAILATYNDDIHLEKIFFNPSTHICKVRRNSTGFPEPTNKCGSGDEGGRKVDYFDESPEWKCSG
jgi:hypothetical protein